MSKVRVGVVRFPGTNCDHDIWSAVEIVGLTPVWLWHRDRVNLEGLKAVIIPGGFSYGDYLRCGALAARSPVMKDIVPAAEKGLPTLGICNGFQVLCESGLLPGALLRNEKLNFIDRWIGLVKAEGETPFAPEKIKGERIKLPVAHGEGRYFITEDGLKGLQDQGQVWWRYEENINGSVDGIAGVTNKQRNVAGLMPHPERAMELWMGGDEGVSFFSQLGL